MWLPKQFSLKALMLAMALLVALLAVLRERSLRQQYALGRMGAEMDGGVGLQSQSFASRLFFGNREGDGTNALRFDGVALSDADAALLALFPNLDTIRLYNCPDPQRSIVVLQTLPNLVWLTVADTPLNDLQIVARFRNLLILDLDNTNVSDDNLIAISELLQLLTLDLENTRVRGPGLSALQSLPRLKNLDLRGCPIDDRALEHLKKFPALNYLQLQRTKVSREAVEQLQQALPNCDIESDHNIGQRNVPGTNGT